MPYVIALLRLMVLGVVVGGLISIGIVFFAIVSILLLAFGSIAWLKEKDILGHSMGETPIVQAPPLDEVIVERKIIEADYEEVSTRH